MLQGSASAPLNTLVRPVRRIHVKASVLRMDFALKASVCAVRDSLGRSVIRRSRALIIAMITVSVGMESVNVILEDQEMIVQ